MMERVRDLSFLRKYKYFFPKPHFHLQPDSLVVVAVPLAASFAASTISQLELRKMFICGFFTEHCEFFVLMLKLI